MMADGSVGAAWNKACLVSVAESKVRTFKFFNLLFARLSKAKPGMEAADTLW